VVRGKRGKPFPLGEGTAFGRSWKFERQTAIFRLTAGLQFGKEREALILFA
jgi:hypothetical protein